MTIRAKRIRKAICSALLGIGLVWADIALAQNPASPEIPTPRLGLWTVAIVFLLWQFFRIDGELREIRALIATRPCVGNPKATMCGGVEKCQ